MKEILASVSILDDKIMYILISGEEFLNYNPPCNECLINNMCIVDHLKGDVKLQKYMKVKYCRSLKKFIDNNKHFTVI